MRATLAAVFGLLLFVPAARASAQVDENTLKLGFEPVATNRETHREWGRPYDKAEEVRQILLRSVPGAELLDDMKIRLNGEKWRVTTDPGVVEVQPPPMLLKDVIAKLTPLYEAFRKAGLVTYNPLTFEGRGGHIHVDKGIFEADPLLLRNVLVDIHNRPYLKAIFMSPGARHNAKSIFEDGSQGKLLDALEALDRTAREKGKYEYRDVHDTLVTRLHGQRYREVNLTNLGGGSPPTVEFRFFHRQQTPQDIYAEALFLVKYLKHLEGIREPIKPTVWTEKTRAAEMDPKRGMESFRALAATLGLEVEMYRGFLDQYKATEPRRGLFRWGQHERGSTPTLGRKAAREAKGAGHFAAAYLIKEAVNAAREGKPDRFIDAAKGMPTPEFVGGFAMFTGIAHGVGRLMDGKRVDAALGRFLPKAARALSRTWLPAAAAIPAVEYAFGERDGGKIARTTAIFTALGAALDVPMMIGMVAVPGPGTAIGAAYFLGKLAFLLWAAEELERKLETPAMNADRRP